MKNKKGITLIALIITIIILLLLAGIVITFVTGNNGILDMASKSAANNNEAEARELLKLSLQEAIIEKTQNGTYNENDYLDQLILSRIPDAKISKNIVVVNGYKFTIDRSNLEITESLGQEQPINDSLLGQISQINDSGNKSISVTGTMSDGTTETTNYSLNMIVYNGDLTLNGTTTVTGATLASNVYSFGNSSSDVGTASTNATNTVVLKVNGNLTINSGITVTSCANASGYGGPKGIIIYCTGDLINNGTITMSARGAKAVGQNIYLWKNLDESDEYIPAVGGSGSNGIYDTYAYSRPSAGANGTNRQTAGRRRRKLFLG